jgi:hypothetical protein
MSSRLRITPKGCSEVLPVEVERANVRGEHVDLRSSGAVARGGSLGGPHEAPTDAKAATTLGDGDLDRRRGYGLSSCGRHRDRRAAKPRPIPRSGRCCSRRRWPSRATTVWSAARSRRQLQRDQGSDGAPDPTSCGEWRWTGTPRRARQHLLAVPPREPWMSSRSAVDVTTPGAGRARTCGAPAT